MLRKDPLQIQSQHKLPLWLKIGYTIFFTFFVAIYWRQYSLSNFLWFSDLTLIMLLPALWLESSFLASIAIVGVLLPELGWNLDFFVRLLTGFHPMNATAYMFDHSLPVYVRAVSLFHVLLPWILIWIVTKLGYQNRALIAETTLVWVVFLTTFLIHPTDNIKWIYGLSNTNQNLMPEPIYLTLFALFYAGFIIFPSHLIC